MPATYLNYIGDEWTPAASGQTFEDINPANREEVLGIFPKSGTTDVDHAVLTARDAFRTWRLVPAPRRAEMIFRAGEILVRRKEE